MDGFNGNQNDFKEGNQDYDNNQNMNSYKHKESENLDAMEPQESNKNINNNDDEFDENYETPVWNNESFYDKKLDGFIKKYDNNQELVINEKNIEAIRYQCLRNVYLDMLKNSFKTFEQSDIQETTHMTKIGPIKIKFLKLESIQNKYKDYI